jgi:hypothetical protein
VAVDALLAAGLSWAGSPNMVCPLILDGLEWPRVRLASDFPSLEELDAADGDGVPYLTPEERDQELSLLYVAVTRARQQLELNEAVRSCLSPQTERPTAGQGYAA